MKKLSTVASTITFFSDPIEYARYEGRPVRAVRVPDKK